MFSKILLTYTVHGVENTPLKATQADTSLDFSNLRIFDLVILEGLLKAKSFRELSRRLKIDPQNLSKRIAFIETVFGARLVERSVEGISLNDTGRVAIEKISNVLRGLEEIKLASVAPAKRLRVCSRAFLIDHFIDRLVGGSPSNLSIHSFDFMDASPDLTERYARRNLLDVVLSFDDILLPKHWARVELEKVDWIFVVGSRHPLAKKPQVDSFEGYRLIGHSHIESEILTSTPSSHLATTKAKEGARVENTRYAIRLLNDQESIAQLPRIAVEPGLQNKTLKELRLRNFNEPKPQQLTLHVDSDRVSNQELKALTKLLKS